MIKVTLTLCYQWGCIINSNGLCFRLLWPFHHQLVLVNPSVVKLAEWFWAAFRKSHGVRSDMRNHFALWSPNNRWQHQWIPVFAMATRSCRINRGCSQWQNIQVDVGCQRPIPGDNIKAVRVWIHDRCVRYCSHLWFYCNAYMRFNFVGFHSTGASWRSFLQPML